MIVYRLTTGKYVNDISGEGASLYGGRWNPAGIAALYSSQHISLCILEILARANKNTSPDSYTLISIEIPEHGIIELQLKKLHADWQLNLEYTRWIGGEFLKGNQALALKVPSAIVPQEHNYLINPHHFEIEPVKVIKTELLELDKRLLQY